MELNLRNVHVLVTGASGGIGIATVRRFLSQGAKVTAHYNTNATTLIPLTEDFGPARIRTVQANLTHEDDVIRMFSSAGQLEFGPVQMVVINHGVWPMEDVPVVKMTLDRWKSTMDINLTSTFLVAREYLKQLEEASDAAKEQASIVLIGSTSGKVGEAGHADYSASKSAMMYGLTLTLKNEIVKIAPRGRVNTVAPGWIRTPIVEEALKDRTILYQSLATTPLKKVGLPDDVATQVMLLSSGTVSGHVTGQVLMVEGGMEGRLLNKPEDILG